MKEFIQKISSLTDLTRGEASSAMSLLMEGQATDAQIAAFLIGMKTKKETTEELLGFVEIMREKSVKVHVEDPDAIDMCGTGGDGSGTFNISTAASFVAAGAGVTVAKHGNRSISSACGSADVLKELGVNIEIASDKVEACINSIGIGFLFAPLFHPSMKYAAKTRAELGVKTFFNMLGPLTNPAGVQRQLVGAYSPEAASAIAQVFEQLHPNHVCVVSSDDGLDEISLSAQTDLWEVQNGTGNSLSLLRASSFGIDESNRTEMRGGDAHENATIIMKILRGEQGPHRDIVLVNAAMGLYVAGIAFTPLEGVAIAEDSIDSGKALHKLNDLVAYTNR